MPLEIECKIYIQDIDAIQQRLQKAGATVTHERVYEHNIRYENARQNLTEQGIVLRLRQDNSSKITYKAPALQSTPGATTRLELETSVGDIQTMQSILAHLGYTPFMVYEKYRTTYHFPDISDGEVVLDEMPYGVFIEIEGTPDSLETIIQRLELTDSHRITASYAYLFELIRAAYDLSFTDLTFENFVGLEIDPDILFNYGN